MVTKELKRERKKVNTNPTEAQKNRGNVWMGHRNTHGCKITMELPEDN